MKTDPLTRLRAVCLALPGANEIVSHGDSSFRVKKHFAMFASPHSHHGRGRPAVWIKALPVNQQLILLAHPDRVFSPPYVGPSGWIGAWLDRKVDWKEIERLVRDGYRLIAPKKLLAQLDAPAIRLTADPNGRRSRRAAPRRA